MHWGRCRERFSPYDEVAVFTYNNGPKMQTDFTAAQSARLGAVIEQSKATGREPTFYDRVGRWRRTININGGAAGSEHDAQCERDTWHESTQSSECAERGAYAERCDSGGRDSDDKAGRAAGGSST